MIRAIKVFPKKKKEHKKAERKKLPNYCYFSFREVLQIVERKKLHIYTNNQNYIMLSYICIWCKYPHLIGQTFESVAYEHDLDSYYLTPQEFEKYVEACK